LINTILEKHKYRRESHSKNLNDSQGQVENLSGVNRSSENNRSSEIHSLDQPTPNPKKSSSVDIYPKPMSRTHYAEDYEQQKKWIDNPGLAQQEQLLGVINLKLDAKPQTRSHILDYSSNMGHEQYDSKMYRTNYTVNTNESAGSYKPGSSLERKQHEDTFEMRKSKLLNYDPQTMSQVQQILAKNQLKEKMSGKDSTHEATYQSRNISSGPTLTNPEKNSADSWNVGNQGSVDNSLATSPYDRG
jgi:hypothetical protein